MNKITSYYIENDILHTYIDNNKHITMSDVKTDKQAEKIIKELNNES